MEIKIGQYEIYSSGTVIGVLNEPISFAIEGLVYEVVFKTIKESTDQKINTIQSDDKKKMTLEFVNFNSGLGTGNKAPLQLGLISNKDLFLNYRVYSLHDEAGKMMHYTWLLKGKKGGTNE